MIYALNTQKMPSQSRRELALHIKNGRDSDLLENPSVVVARGVAVGEGRFYCIYCNRRVFKWWLNGNVKFYHQRNEGCLGTDKGLPGIVNPRRLTMPGRRTALCP